MPSSDRSSIGVNYTGKHGAPSPRSEGAMKYFISDVGLVHERLSSVKRLAGAESWDAVYVTMASAIDDLNDLINLVEELLEAQEAEEP